MPCRCTYALFVYVCCVLAAEMRRLTLHLLCALCLCLHPRHHLLSQLKLVRSITSHPRPTLLLLLLLLLLLPCPMPAATLQHARLWPVLATTSTSQAGPAWRARICACIHTYIVAQGQCTTLHPHCPVGCPYLCLVNQPTDQPTPHPHPQQRHEKLNKASAQCLDPCACATSSFLQLA